MRLSTIVDRLLREGSIERTRVNWYRVLNTPRTRQLNIPEGTVIHPLSAVHTEFAVQVGPNDYVFRTSPRPERARFTPASFSHSASPSTPASAPRPAEPQPLRRIRRDSYHSNGNGTSRYGIEEALSRIALDSDGVRRSFGLEWEVYSLNSTQEDKLARLLDTLPAHFTERDASLGEGGVEIIFLPLGLEKIKEVWNTLQAFCRDNDVRMNGAGAHITYGVSNSEVSIDDLQIRINRIALAVKAASTQSAIKTVFGRDFTGYAALPQSTTTRGHSNAWSASRGNSAYELRLCAWKGDINKITEMMLATEFVFHRTFTARDFLKIFEIMGSDCSGI